MKNIQFLKMITWGFPSYYRIAYFSQPAFQESPRSQNSPGNCFPILVSAVEGASVS